MKTARLKFCASYCPVPNTETESSIASVQTEHGRSSHNLGLLPGYAAYWICTDVLLPLQSDDVRDSQGMSYRKKVITPVNSFKNLSFLMAVYGENAFWASGDFVAAVPRMGTGNKNWKRGWALTVTCAVLWYIHDMRGREVWNGRALPEKNHTANTEIKRSWL